MAYTTIDDPVEYFSATLYTANGTARTIATGHQSDWVWLKRRDGAAGHRIADSVRGANKLLYSDSSTSEQSASNTITGFVSTGFTLGDDSGGYDVNTSSNTMVGWSWKESATAGFDIVSYTGTGSAKTVSHNLGVKPDVIICKSRSGTEEWRPYFSVLGATYGMRLNGTNAKDDDAGYWNDTEPTSSVFTVGTNSGTNGNTVTFIAYCFAEKKGYSKFGSYVGNGNADGTFVYTGFKPSFVMAKMSSSTGNWSIFDNKRSSFNVVDEMIKGNSSQAELADSSRKIDFNSSGFKIRADHADINTSGGTYIYMAFAESPFVNSNGVPNNAR